MKRKVYNINVLERCIKQLQSHDANDICEGVVLAAYLTEQAIKSELRAINPLLYFDRRGLSDDLEIRIAIGKLSPEEVRRLRTSPAKRVIAHICEHHSKLKPHKAIIEELFQTRNIILHSTDDPPFDGVSTAEIAVTSLRACRDLIIKHCGISPEEINPVTSHEFDELQKRGKQQRIADLEERILEHRKEFNKLDAAEVSERMRSNAPKIDSTTWIEDTVECPACGQISLDRVGMVDFDWNPDGILAGGGIRYQCRVCELDLSEYEYETATRF